MNQIDVLKNISEFGNPKDRPEVLKYYNQYKNDPTFRNLAISLAESETGYSSLNDSTKNVYKTYKDSIEKTFKPTQTQEQKSIPDQISSGLKTGLESIFPRVSQSSNPVYSPENILNAGLDIASFPGRVIASTAKAPGNINEFVSDVGKIYSENPSTAGFVEDIARSPYNIIPGVGGLAAKGAMGVTTKLAPELLPKIASVIPKGPILTPLAAGLGQVAKGAGTAADIGITENISQGKNPFENLANNMIPGLVMGSIPGAYSYAKGRNTEKIAEGMLPKLEEMGANIPKNRPENLLAGLDQMAAEIGVKLPADQIGKIREIPNFLKIYNGRMGTKYTPGTFENILEGIKTPTTTNQGYGPVDILDLMSIGALIHPSSPSMSIGALYPAAKLLEKNTPLVEQKLAPLADKLAPLQNLGRGIMGSYISR